MIKEILSIVRFLAGTHKTQLLSLGGVYLILVVLSIILFLNSNVFYYDFSGVLVLISFAVVTFLFSGYLGYLFRTENKSNFMTILPFSSKALNSTPHVLFFILAALNYLLLKDLWDEAHVFFGVSEVSFLFGAPYIVFYSLRKIETQWIGVLTAFIICFMSLFIWIKFLAIWNIYQWGIVTEATYTAVVLLLVFVLERKKDSVFVVLSCLLVFLTGKTLMDISLAPNKMSQAVAKVQFFPHKYSIDAYSTYMTNAKSWDDYVISPFQNGSYQRQVFKFSRHFNDQFWNDEQKIKFLKIIDRKISFDRNNQNYDTYSYHDYPLSKESLPKEKRMFLAESSELNPIGCFYLPLIDNEKVRDSLFHNPKCGKEKLLSTEVKWNYLRSRDTSFLFSLKTDLMKGRGRDISEINWGVSTVFGLNGKTHGKSRSWYKDNGITNHEFDKLTQNIYSDEKMFFNQFNKLEKNKKISILEKMDFSNDESRIKNWKRLKFICRNYSKNCNGLPRWEDKGSLFSVIKDYFHAKKFSRKYYYWLVKEINRNI